MKVLVADALGNGECDFPARFARESLAAACCAFEFVVSGTVSSLATRL